MKVNASAKMVRISPRKVRLVLDEVRGLSVSDAERVLQHMNKKAARPTLKLIQSAAANAVNNFNLDRDSLKIVSLTANEGPTIKRYRPRAFGRATMIRKRTSHLHVTVEPVGEKKEAAKAAPKKKAAAKKPAAKKTTAKKATAKKPAAKKTASKTTKKAAPKKTAAKKPAAKKTTKKDSK